MIIDDSFGPNVKDNPEDIIMFDQLKDILKKMKRVIIAYSGGIDSTFLLKVASDAIGANVLSVIAVSSTYPRRELVLALKNIKRIGAHYRIVLTRELDDPKYKSNTIQRCYFCKKELFSIISRIALNEEYSYIADGFNIDDLNDYRPGVNASNEMKVRHPLQEAGYSKSAIRRASQRLGLINWDQPASACLASRIPYTRQLSRESLKQIEAAEDYLNDKIQIQGGRVRIHGNLARIEVPQKQFRHIIDHARLNELVDRFKVIGFRYVTLDLQGYRTGSMNEEAAEQIQQNKS